jgi:hypothetical protein
VEQEELAVLVAAVTLVRLAVIILVLLVLLIQVAAVEEEVINLPLHKQAATAALALLSLKYLTTYSQHSLAALHRACLHPVGLTSIL